MTLGQDVADARGFQDVTCAGTGDHTGAWNGWPQGHLGRRMARRDHMRDGMLDDGHLDHPPRRATW